MVVGEAGASHNFHSVSVQANNFKRPRMGAIASVGVMMLTLSLPTPANARVADPIMDTALQVTLDAGSPGDTIPVIAICREQADLHALRRLHRKHRRRAMVRRLRETAGKSQRHLRKLLRRHGVRDVIELWAINGLSFQASSAVIRTLARQHGIATITLDATLDAPGLSFEEASPSAWHLDAIRAPELWALGLRGQGVVVASLDSGVDALHPDLGPRWRGGANSWFDPHGEHLIPFDGLGHGTQTMGLMVGGDAGGTAIGVAPEAQWIAAKIFDDEGSATLSDIHRAFQWVLDPDGDPATDDAPDVVNCSWNLAGTTNLCVPEFTPDIEVLKAAGVAVTFSASNYGPAPFSSVSPANGSGFAIGAVDQSLAVAEFSSRGPSACGGGLYPQLVAPGVQVRTTDLTFGGQVPDSYVSVAGTSFAAPQTAGTMALLREAYPDATVADLEAALAGSALDLGLGGPDDTFGYGLVDVMEAYRWLGDPAHCECAPTAEVVADTTVQETNPRANYDDSSALSADADSPKHVLLKIAVSGTRGGVTDATLRLTVRDVHRAESDSGGMLQRISDCSWDARTIDYEEVIHTGLLDGVPGQEQGPVDREDAVTFDLTPWITDDGMYCFAITSESSNGVDYNSTEAGGGGPVVSVATSCSCPSTTVSTTPPPSTTTTSTSIPTTTTTLIPAPGMTTTTSTTSSTTTTTTTMPMPCSPIALVVADARVEAKHDHENYGGADLLGADARSEKFSLFEVRLDCVGRRQVSLAMTVAREADEDSAGSDSGGYVQWLASSFDEHAVDFKTAPGFVQGTAGEPEGPVGFGDVVLFDLGTPGDGTHYLAIRSDSSNGVDYYSREAPTDQPRLIVAPAP